jgi:probable F420-dependent oxidoreductase
MSLELAVGEDFAQHLDVARMAEAKGVDLITGHDHVALGAFKKEDYPESDVGFPTPLDAWWPEPLTILSAFAAVTSRVRFSTSILIGPLRPAVLLAKQLATLDVISGGRTEVGLGAGWQKAEFAASGVSFEHRYRYLDEQIQACRAVWKNAPATFSGSLIRFEGLYVRPAPVQPAGIPIWIGAGTATPRGVERIAKFADGWNANTFDVEDIGKSVRLIRAALKSLGRDPASLQVHSEIKPVYLPNGSADFDAMFATVPAMIEAGATTIAVMPGRYCKSFKEVELLVDRLVSCKQDIAAKQWRLRKISN